VVDTEVGFHSSDDLAARTRRLVGHGS
jgi:hypothetical protein